MKTINYNALLKFFIALCIIALFVNKLEAQVSNNEIKSKRQYKVIFVLQKDYNESLEQLKTIKNISDKLPHNKKISVSNSYCYRSDIEKIKEFDGKIDNVVDNIFFNVDKNINCSEQSVQTWFECALKNYPLSKSFDDIVILNSSKEKNVKYVKSIEKNYKIYYDENQLINSVDSIIETYKKSKKSKTIVIMHYFNDKPVVIVQKCDTIESFISKNVVKYKPILLDLSYDTVIKPTGRYKPANDNVYVFKWKAESMASNYELFLNDIKFDISINIGSKYMSDIAYIEDGVVYFYLSEKALGERCSEEYGIINKDCDECNYACIYKKLWKVKVRAVECGKYYGPFSDTIEKVSLQCIHGG